jgi:P2 family phage contractile tail tube protein
MNAGRINEISLPKLSVKTEEHRAGGMDIPVAFCRCYYFCAKIMLGANIVS